MESNIPIVLAAVIVLHHYKKHYNDTKLTELEKFVQWGDINNHETWALFFLGIGLGMKLNRAITKRKISSNI